MDILAKIKGIKYNPLLCRDLEVFDYKNLEMTLASCASFILNINKENKVAISWWVSAKRTRSYPYTRVYVIIAYYSDAKRSTRYKHKITNQRFDIDYIKEQIKNILSYQSDSLHWNLSHVDKVGKIGEKAMEAYAKISKKLKVEMHSRQTAEKRIIELFKGKDEFMK